MSDTPIDIAHLRCKVTIKFRYTQTNTTSPRLNKSNGEIILSFFFLYQRHINNLLYIAYVMKSETFQIHFGDFSHIFSVILAEN